MIVYGDALHRTLAETLFGSVVPNQDRTVDAWFVDKPIQPYVA